MRLADKIKEGEATNQDVLVEFGYINPDLSITDKGWAFNKEGCDGDDIQCFEPLNDTDDALSLVPDNYYVLWISQRGNWYCHLSSKYCVPDAKCGHKNLPTAIILAVLETF